MTLNDLLKTLPANEVVLIGGSSAYFYIGTVLHFYEVEEYLSNILYEQWVTRKSRLLAEIKRICFHGVKRDPVEINGELISNHQKFLKETIRRLGVAWSDYKETEDILNNFVSLRSREIREDSVTPIMLKHKIIVKGKEGGIFWLEGEYKAWEKKVEQDMINFYDKRRKEMQAAETDKENKSA